MKQLLLPIVFVLTASTALAEQTFFTRQPCDAFDKMFTTIAEYGEELLFTGDGLQFSAQTGQAFQGGTFYFVNQETGTWSLLSLYGDGNACMIANGNNFKPYSGPKMPVKPKPEVESREPKVVP